MSYKALYRKYRPKTFDEVMGQDHIISTLKNIIDSDKISHAYLFTGPRGTGKTSVAHVFANEINKTAGESLNDNSLDIIEIDAASNNGVAEIRNIIDNSHYAPSSSKFKVYIIDEVHMLTKGAFNALLKTLEEPPAHLVFILATTEPHKIPVTILSRTQRFNFRRIDDKVISTQLKAVLEKEDITFESEAIKYISKLAQGGMRDAFSIADQAASYGNSNITFVSISQVFGVISVTNQIKIIELAFSKKTNELLSVSNQFINNGVDIERLTTSLIDVLKDFIVFKKTNDISLSEMLSQEDIDSIKFTIGFAYEAIDEFVKLLGQLKFTPIPKQIFELSLLKLVNINSLEGKIEDTLDIKVSPEKEETEVIKADLFETQEMGSGEVKVHTDEIDLISDEASKEIEDIANTQEIDNQILSTQDIPLGELSQEDNVPTEEININSYFNTEETQIPSKETPQVTNADEIINLLVQADKQKSEMFKDKLINIYENISKVKNKNYITLLKDTVFISGGNGFILVSSHDENIVNQINREKSKQEFIDFINNVFGEPLLTFAISKTQFEEIKKTWIELSEKGQLPESKQVPQVKASEKPKSDAEQLGEELFGDLFN